MPRQIQRYGWIPDLPDARDHLFAAPAAVMIALPPRIDLRDQCPPVYDQGQLGSCTANAIAAALQFDQKKQHIREFVPSRLFIYYNERVIEGTVGSDSGAMLRDGIKSVNNSGACSEDKWAYDIARFIEPPPDDVRAAALENRAVAYQSLPQIPGQLKGCLASGYPFVFGFSVYASFESPEVAQSGNVPMPASTEAQLGGHAVLAVGYDDTSQTFLVRNSWGPAWGMSGYFTMPYAYLVDHTLATDFWTIRQVVGAPAVGLPEQGGKGA